MADVTQFLSNVPHYVVPFALVLSVVVFAHEFGHYIVARLCGVRVLTFSIGFGREIFGWTDSHGTRWKVSWMPLGGYVKMFGDVDPASLGHDPALATLGEAEKREAFFFQSVGKRMAIVVAGPAANYIFAIFVLAGLFLFFGEPFTAPVVDKIVADSVAAKAGFQPGDRVQTIDDRAIASFEDIKDTITMNMGTPVAIGFERDGEHRVLQVTPEVVRMKDRLGMEHNIGRLGITSTALEYRQLTLLGSFGHAVGEAWSMTANTVRGLGQMIIGVRSPDELGGPLRIAEMSGKVAKQGAAELILFIAMLSINLGFINLFPIPLLDGGHLVFYIAEKLRGRPLGEKAQDYAASFGAFVVISLMVFSTWNDLQHVGFIAYIRGWFS